MEIPFYTNLDDSHCFQACLKMIAKHFWPNEDFSWEFLDKVTNKVPGKWTWNMAGCLWLQSKGVLVKDIEIFDYDRFSVEGKLYLVELFGKEVADKQEEMSILGQEFEFAREFAKKIEIEKRIPDLKDIKSLLDEGFLLIPIINSRVLDLKPGYTGHFVVLTSYNDKEGVLILNDPGDSNHGTKKRVVSYDLFKKAWAYPNEKAKNLMAFKYS